MSDFRLKIFHTVAKKLSFTKASEELFISQPAVTKNIKELETEYNVTLFRRKGNKIELTNAGETFFSYAEKILSLYNQLSFDLNAIQQNFSGIFQLGASTTVGQYLIPNIMSLFHTKHPSIKLSLINANTQEIEDLVKNNKIHLGIVEGKPKNRELKYIPFIKDEIVVIAHTSQPIAKKDSLTLDELTKIPMVLREPGSGSLDIIKDTLEKKGIFFKYLNISMHLGNTESIKSYLTHTNNVGLVSITAVNKEIKNGEFKIIDVDGLEIKRFFYFIHNQGIPDNISNLFMQFAVNFSKSVNSL